MSSRLEIMEQATSSVQRGFLSSVPRPSSLMKEQIHKPPLSQSCPLRSRSRPRADHKSTMDADLAKVPRSSGHAGATPVPQISSSKSAGSSKHSPKPHLGERREGRREPGYLADLLCPRALTLALGALAWPPSSRNSHTPSAVLGPGL